MHTQPAEEIEAVLGRFQSWAGTQGLTKANRGIRELSYDEALSSSRYRWPGANRPSAKKKQDQEPPAAKPEAKASPQPRRKPQPKAKAATVAKDRVNVKPAFRDALEEAVRPVPVAVAQAQPAELGRQVAISIRLAPAERAMIKTRAAEAGITASAYIRQCALEIEQLRAQVREAVARMERGSATAVGTAAPATSSSGFFARSLHRLFHRRSPSLALRV